MKFKKHGGENGSSVQHAAQSLMGRNRNNVDQQQQQQQQQRKRQRKKCGLMTFFIGGSSSIFLILQIVLIRNHNNNLSSPSPPPPTNIIDGDDYNPVLLQSPSASFMLPHQFKCRSYDNNNNITSTSSTISTSTLYNNKLYCCSLWTAKFNSDLWWLHHPHWEVSYENDTIYCFSPIENQIKAQFLKQLHFRQWGVGIVQKEEIHNYNNTKLCQHNVETSIQMNAGYGSSIRWLTQSFWHAYHISNVTFQIEGTPPYRPWLYATRNKTHDWAYCEAQDISCYYLDISPCPKYNVSNPKQHLIGRPNRHPTKQQQKSTGYPSEMLQFFWIQEYYLLRPKQLFRYQLYKLRNQIVQKMTFPCIAMHIRRGDAGMPRPPYRRYAAVQEYIDLAEIQPGDTIFLMTDDVTTIEEIQQYHSNTYNWVYLDRPRNRGISGGFDGHIPSGDEGYEMVAIGTELQIASQCTKIVYGKSGFMDSLIQLMNAEQRNYTLYYLNTKVSKEEGTKFGQQSEKRVQHLFQYIDTVTNKTS